MIRWTFPILAASLTLAACNSSPMASQDPRRAKKSADAAPGFSLTSSQTCGAKAPEALPADETARDAIELLDLADKLAGDGLDGWVHAAAAPFGEYVFTYRRPGDFFSHLEMAMIPANDEAKQFFSTIKRGDKIHVVGTLVNKISPLGHILVTSAAMVKEYKPVTPLPQYDYGQSLQGLADELKQDDVLYAVVHAQTATGGVLVLDYKNIVLPVFVTEENRETAKALYRGDVVGLAYTIRQSPQEPLHIETKAGVSNAIVTYDHMVWCNGQERTLTGELVLFEKSPQISQDVYALRNTDANGMQRNWTLVNFDDDAIWQAIKAKLTEAWKAHEDQVVNGRNQLLNPKIKVTATGRMNVVSPSQANPQIFLAGPDSIQIDILE